MGGKLLQQSALLKNLRRIACRFSLRFACC